MTLFPVMSSIVKQIPRFGERTALIDGAGQVVNYIDLYHAILRHAAALQQQGIQKGDRVLLVEDNSINFVVSLWACFLVGAVVVPVSAEITPDRMGFIVKNSGGRLAISHIPKVQKMLGDLVEVHVSHLNTSETENVTLSQIEKIRGPLTSSDIALIIYTSGSTGDPKGVTLSHLNVFSACQSTSSYLGINAQDRIFCAIPFTFDYGMHQITMSALHGASLHIETSFARPHLSLARIAKEKITCVPIVPAMVRMMKPLHSRYDLSTVKKVTNTAAALRPAMIDALSEMLPAADIFSMYGLTECHRCTYLPPEELSAHPTSVGYAIPDTDMWVVDAQGNSHSHSATGELMIRGNTVMQGYWNNPEQTAKRLHVDPVTGARHLKTGDLCQLDAKGRLTFISRCDAILKVRGEKWIPMTADNELARFPHCAEVACVAVEDPLGDMRTMAFIVPHATADVQPQTLRRWCVDNLESVYVPERFEITDELPRTPNGKPDVQTLTKIATSHFA